MGWEATASYEWSDTVYSGEIMELQTVFILLAFFCVASFGYKLGKLNGFNLGLEYLRKKGISHSAAGCEHYCNVTTCNVVCFEREGELWVKEYSGFNSGTREKEGRTYMVFHCPWCGYQTHKSKMHEMVKITNRCPKIPSSEGC